MTLFCVSRQSSQIGHEGEERTTFQNKFCEGQAREGQGE